MCQKPKKENVWDGFLLGKTDGSVVGRLLCVLFLMLATYMFVDENQFETEAETVQVSIFLQTNVKGF